MDFKSTLSYMYLGPKATDHMVNPSAYGVGTSIMSGKEGEGGGQNGCYSRIGSQSWVGWRLLKNIM